MGADDSLAMRKVAADLGRRDRRTVAGKDRIRRGELLQFGEDVLLERELLRRRFEDEGRALHGRRECVVRLDALRERRIVFEQIDDRLQSRRQRCADVRRRLEHGDLVARGGEQVSDAVTHQAAADHAYFLFPLITHVCLTRFFGTATMSKRYLNGVYSATDPQRRNGHARPSVGRFLVVDYGYRRVLGRGAPADSGRGTQETKQETKSVEQRLTGGITAIDIHHLSGTEIGRRR